MNNDRSMVSVASARWLLGVAALAGVLLLLGACKTTDETRASNDGHATPLPSSAPPTPSSLEMEDAAAKRSKVVGMDAPDFSLVDADEKLVKLSDLRGKWVVLYFYPQDDTPGCQCQASEFTTLLANFHSLGATVMGVSPDSPASKRFFREKYALGVTLLSDPEHVVMKRYGSWVTTTVGEQTQGRVIRSTFLIDPKGKIAYHWPEVIPQGHAERVKAKLVSLRGK